MTITRSTHRVGQVLRCGDAWGLVLRVTEGVEDDYGVLDGRLHLAVLAAQPVASAICPSCWQEEGCCCDGSDKDPWEDVSKAFLTVSLPTTKKGSRDFWALDSVVTVVASRASGLEVMGEVQDAVVGEVCKRVATAMRRRVSRKLSPSSGKWVERCYRNASAVLSPNGDGLG